jgi:hypothetical protein
VDVVVAQPQLKFLAGIKKKEPKQIGTKLIGILFS